MQPYTKFEKYFIETKDILRQKEDEYFVLVYWTNCPHCLAIVSSISKYIESNPKIKLYLLDFTGEKECFLFKDTIQNDNESMLDFIDRYSIDSIGAKNVKDINYYYVPMLLHIKSKKVYNCVVLENNIENYLKEYEK